MPYNLFFFSLLFFSLTNLAYTQSLPFMMRDEGNQWSVFQFSVGGCYVIYGHTEHLSIQGDSIINNIKYKKLFQRIPSWSKGNTLIGLLREDPIEKKVWMRTLDNQEGLMYDFSVDKGDSVQVYNPFEQFNYTFIVDDVKIENINGHDYKIWIFTNSYDCWIEEIGSESGLIYYPPITYGGGSRLACFSGRHANYMNPLYNSCEMDTANIGLLSSSPDTAISHQEYEFQVVSTDTAGYIQATYYNCWNMPKGLSLDSQTGLISGIPVESGIFYLMICVSNMWFTTDCSEYNLYVEPNTEMKDEKAKQHTLVYPNPANDLIIIENIINTLPGEIEIFDCLGMLRKRIHYDHPSVSLEIDIRDLERGIYIIHFSSLKPVKFVKI